MKSAKRSDKSSGTLSARQLAVNALRQVHQGGYADVVVDRLLGQNPLESRDRRLFTEVVYGAVRRMRTLDAVIDALAKKSALAASESAGGAACGVVSNFVFGPYSEFGSGGYDGGVGEGEWVGGVGGVCEWAVAAVGAGVGGWRWG